MKFCEVCNVKYASDAEAVDLHESGKRHIRLEASYKELKDIAEKSVYIKWPIKLNMSVPDIQIEVAKFGTVSRFLHKDGTNFAIVEFANAASANDALSAAHINLPQGTVTVLKRELDFNSDAEEKKINIEQIMVDVAKVPFTNEDTYGPQMQCVIDHIVIPDEQMESRRALIQRLEVEINKYFREVKIKIFGSSITTIGTIDSDVDASLEFDSPDSRSEFERDKFVLLTTNPEFFAGNKIGQNEMSKLSLADQTRLLCKILNEIRKNVSWLGHQRPVLDARCPVVRFTINKKLIVDLSCENVIGRHKSEYIRTLICNDKSGNLRRILLAFRFWALSNDLFEPLPKQHKGQFNAYMLNLMLVYFLIQRNALPVVGPSKQAKFSQGYRIDFEVPEYTLDGLSFPTLFKEFFRYMIDLKTESCVIVGYQQKVIPLELFEGAGEPGVFRLGVLNVQDPLELGHNVCQNVCQKLLSRMKRRMSYSLSKMKLSGHSFSDLLCLGEEKPSGKESKEAPSTVRLYVVPEGKCFESALNRVKNFISLLCEDILGFDPIVQPLKKRSRVQYEEMEELESYSINVECWIGRRSMRKKVAEKMKAGTGRNVEGFELEREITRTILKTTKVPSTPLGEVLVGIAKKERELFFTIIPLMGADTLFKNITHFLETFVSNYEREVIRAVTDQEPMEE